LSDPEGWQSYKDVRLGWKLNSWLAVNTLQKTPSGRHPAPMLCGTGVIGPTADIAYSNSLKIRVHLALNGKRPRSLLHSRGLGATGG